MVLQEAFDRKIFYLEDRVSLEEYKSKFPGNTIREKSSTYSTEITAHFAFDWDLIAPECAYPLEQSVELKSVFRQNKLSSQLVYFVDSLSANIIFELFENDPGWTRNNNDDVTGKHLASTDNKYALIFRDNSEEIVYTLQPYSLHLIYKNV